MTTNESILPASLNKQVRDFLLKNVRLVYDDSPFFDPARGGCAGAGVFLTKDGYILTVGRYYKNQSEKVQSYILYHEMAHILRGDCVLMMKKKMTQGQGRAWNIAADAGINYGLDEDVVKETNGIWYPQLITMFENNLPTDWLPSTQQIYDALLEAGKEGEMGESDSIGYDESATEKELRKQHARTLLNAREVLQEVPELKQHIDSLTWSTGQAVGRRKIVAEPCPLPLASIILKHINGKAFGTRVPQRTFSREGRVEGLRGSALLPRIKILAAIDVSGSCTHLVSRFVGATKWLAKRHSVDIVAFDTQLYKYSPDVPVGGGTAFSPVYEYASFNKYDACLLLSDGCAGDVEPMPRMPLIWIMPEGESIQVPTCRGGDKLIMLPKGKE